MSKICYVDKKFSRNSLSIIETANNILVEYAEQGYDLTLRQLYYQFVSRGLIANKQTEYDRVGSIISDARLAGHIDWKHIIDRTRSHNKNSHWESPAEIIKVAAEGYRIDKWADQEWYVEVWVEKDALIGVLEVACAPLDVSYFSCRGYTSQSAMWQAAMRIANKYNEGKMVKIIHLGDHDPSGKDMTRDIADRLRLFCDYHIGDYPKVERIALNMNQVEQYGPPPNPAKITDSRAAGYIQEFGSKSWELDALSPDVIKELIENAVAEVRDDDIWERAIEKEEDERAQLKVIEASLKK